MRVILLKQEQKGDDDLLTAYALFKRLGIDPGRKFHYELKRRFLNPDGIIERDGPFMHILIAETDERVEIPLGRLPEGSFRLVIEPRADRDPK